MPAIVASAAARIQVIGDDALGADAREERQVLVVGIGAHRLAGPGLLQEPEQRGDGDEHHDDGQHLRRAQRQPLLEAAPVAEVADADHEALAVLEALVVGADHEAGERVVDEHDPDRGDDEDHRVAAPGAVEAIDEAVGREREHDRAEDADRQREERGRQRRDADAGGLQRPGGEDDDHRAEGHHVAVREVGEAQHRVDQRDAERAERELRAVGDRRDDDEVREEDEGVEEVLHRQPPRKVRRTSGSASRASPVSVKRLRPWTST